MWHLRYVFSFHKTYTRRNPFILASNASVASVKLFLFNRKRAWAYAFHAFGTYDIVMEFCDAEKDNDSLTTFTRNKPNKPLRCMGCMKFWILKITVCSRVFYTCKDNFTIFYHHWLSGPFSSLPKLSRNETLSSRCNYKHACFNFQFKVKLWQPLSHDWYETDVFLGSLE